MDTQVTEAQVRALVERYVLPTEAARLLPLLAQSWLAQREALDRLAWHYHAMHLGCYDDEVPDDFPWEECTEEHCSLIRAALGEEAAHGDQ